MFTSKTGKMAHQLESLTAVVMDRLAATKKSPTQPPVAGPKLEEEKGRANPPEEEDHDVRRTKLGVPMDEARILSSAGAGTETTDEKKKKVYEFMRGKEAENDSDLQREVSMQ